MAAEPYDLTRKGGRGPGEGETRPPEAEVSSAPPRPDYWFQTCQVDPPRESVVIDFGSDGRTAIPLESYIEYYVHPDDRAAFLRAVTEHPPGPGSIGGMDLRMRRDHRDFQARILFRLETSGDLSMTVTSIDDLKGATVVRSGEWRQFEEYQRLEALGVTAGGLVHDFNNLLLAILGNAALASKSLPEESDVRPLLAQIEQASAQAADLTRGLLALARDTSPDARTSISVSDLILESTELLKSIAGPRAVFSFDVGRGTHVHADASQLRQVLLNLVTNACEAMPHREGVLAIRARRLDPSEVDPSAKGFVFAENLPDAATVAFEVEDNGMGMTPEVQARLFDPFFTTKKAGRGLGMSAIAGIVHSHDGALRVRSKIGQGTTVTVFLPAVAPPEKPSQADIRETATRDLGGRRILVIDDEALVREVARRSLERLGCNVVLATSGEEALRLVENSGPYDLALIDFILPDFHGETLLKRILERQPGIPAIFSSGTLDTSDVRLARSEGNVALLPKPYRPQQLQNLVAEMLSSGK